MKAFFAARLGFQKLRTARQRPNAIIVTVAIVVSSAILASLGWFVASERAALLGKAERDVRNLSRGLSQQSERDFATAAMVQQAIAERLRKLGVETAADLSRLSGNPEFHRVLVESIASLSFIDAMTVIDRGGNVVNSSRDRSIPQVNVADRDDFRAIVTDPTLSNVIGRPMRGRGEANASIYLANPLTATDGTLLGITLVAIGVSHIEDLYASFAMPGGRATLIRQDGMPLASYPRVDTEDGKASAEVALLRGATVPARPESMPIVERDDTKRRIASFAPLSHFPLIVVVDVSLAAILSDWSVMSTVFGVVAGVVLVLIASTAVVLSAVVDRQRRTAQADRARLEAELAATSSAAIARHAGRFEVALNTMLHALCMFDAQKRLIICNKRYVEMYDLPENLTRPGTSWDDIAVHRRKKFGFRTDDWNNIQSLHRRDDLKLGTGATTTSHVLGDGRSILVWSKPIEEGGWVAVHEDVTDRRRTEERMDYLAHHDSLTGLPNRLLFQERLEQALSGIGSGTACAILLVDLDRFKDINDTLGHPIGDALLRQVAERLRHCVGERDTVARIGGDEFAILQGVIGGRDDPTALASRIVERLAGRFDIEGYDITVGASIGIACAPEHHTIGENLLRKADIALYRVKAEGRGGWRFFEATMAEAVRNRHDLEVDLRRAVERQTTSTLDERGEPQDFELYFQPLVTVRCRKIRSFEALIRWHHAERGLVSPLDFIPLAEETGLILPLGEWILAAACRQAALWPSDIRVSVNVSAAQFKSPDLVAVVARTLEASGLAPGRLELEITESVLLHENDANLAILESLRDLGTRIVMDDFGSGYSSLNYLRIFPFDKIKIDKSFVQNLAENNAKAIVWAIAELGRRIDMTTTAEGIETESQFEEVQQLGCTEAQGFLFSRPLPAYHVGELLTRFGSEAHVT